MTVAIILLKSCAAITMISFGIHQLISPQSWFDYIPDILKKSPGLTPARIMRLHALGNCAFGLFLVAGPLPLIAAWAAFIWWVSLLPFTFLNDWAIGMRDLSITLSLLALIFLLS